MLKISSFTLLFFFFCWHAIGQKDTIHIHFFPSGKISTISYLENNRMGKAIAYNFEGKVIFESSIRRIHGSESVTFRHYPNGMVQRADYSSHPDGGIQWYRSSTFFNEKGEKIDEQIDDYEGPGQPRLRIRTQPKDESNWDEIQEDNTKVEEQKKEVAICASIHKNSVEIINHSRWPILFNYQIANNDTLITIQSGETYTGPVFISAEIAGVLNQDFSYQYAAKRRNRRLKAIYEKRETAPLNTLHQIHIFETNRSN
ncbi:MAG: hypothetical protein JJT77_06195 [Crocinitomicaceae bacterium]|nr:hypothetical protein [Crocinitomicaceae bacterium]